jgi:hypothetical protein
VIIVPELRGGSGGRLLTVIPNVFKFGSAHTGHHTRPGACSAAMSADGTVEGFGCPVDDLDLTDPQPWARAAILVTAAARSLESVRSLGSLARASTSGETG